VQALLARIRRCVPAHAPMIIGGDFNDWSNRLAPLFVQQLGLFEVFAVSPKGLPRRTLRVRPGLHELGMDGLARATPPPRTFPATFPWLRLDRIYQRGFAVRRAQVLHGLPWRQLSDHAPVLAELELP